MGLYKNDFYAWTQHTAELLKLKQYTLVNWHNLIEEVESLGKHERDRLISSLKVLLTHLLKWEY